jgi:hypothetical protein
MVYIKAKCPVIFGIYLKKEFNKKNTCGEA